MDNKKEKEEQKETTKTVATDLDKRYCLGCEMGYENQQGHMGGCLPSEEEMCESMGNK